MSLILDATGPGQEGPGERKDLSWGDMIHLHLTPKCHVGDGGIIYLDLIIAFPSDSQK